MNDVRFSRYTFGFLLGVIALMPGNPVSAQTPNATASLSIDVQIVEGLSLVVNRGLDFGEIIAGAGRVTITRSSSESGKFIVRGAGNATLTVTFTQPANNKLVRAEGSGDLDVNTQVYGSVDDAPENADLLVDGASITLGENGEYYFFVEGALDVGPVESNPAGSYSGILTMTIAYQ